MYKISMSEGQFPLYEIRDDQTDSWFIISPARGGIVTSYGVNGEESLYFEQATFDDPHANIRGGIPILFPICGQLPDQSYEWEGQTYILENHGVARTNPWVVAGTEIWAHYAAITIMQTSTPQTLRAFPFEYELVFTFRLEGGKLTISQDYLNHSAQDMPMYAGFHPYFLVDHKVNTVESDAKQIHYLTAHEVHAYEGDIEMNKLPDSIALSDASANQITFSPRTGKKIQLSYGNEFQYVVLWSLDGKPFLCVEPWMALVNALNTKQDLNYVKQGKPLSTYLGIQILAAI